MKGKEERRSDIMDLTRKRYKIAVAGTGYVGLSMATLLAQHNQVVAVDIIEEKVNLINQEYMVSGARKKV